MPDNLTNIQDDECQKEQINNMYFKGFQKSPDSYQLLFPANLIMDHLASPFSHYNHIRTQPKSNHNNMFKNGLRTKVVK